MRLGLNLGYLDARTAADDCALAVEADALGYAVCWVAEAYGSDAVSVLAWIAARTRRMDVGSAVMQIPARTPAMTAMTAATLDLLSGGRFRLGLGVSGPQVSEGWHGVAFEDPLGRTREYVEVVRLVLARERLRYAGRHWRLPAGDGPALALALRPVREHIPVYVAAVGPGSCRLTGRIADGWLASFFAPEHARMWLDPIEAGRWEVAPAAQATPGAQAAPAAQATPGASPAPGFDVVASVPVMFTDDLTEAVDALRPHVALYLGGMGSRHGNVYANLAAAMGFEADARTVQELYLAGDHRSAAAAVPAAFVEATSLIGPDARVRDRLQAFADAGVTTLAVRPVGPAPAARRDALHRTVDAFAASGVGSQGPS